MFDLNADAYLKIICWPSDVKFFPEIEMSQFQCHKNNLPKPLTDCFFPNMYEL